MNYVVHRQELPSNFLSYKTLFNFLSVKFLIFPISFSCNIKNAALHNRPSTAQPEKTSKSNHSTQPPSPTLSAWASGGSAHGSHSPLVRPMSAGPFHRPVDFHSNNIASRPVRDLSTAPLIEAIQHELRKFQNDPK